ncbi:MAG: ASCH domain-containing protein [Blautia sp.]|nr:ASCH domain-containing protein [Blautia sp.]
MSAMLLSIRPEYAQRIIDGTKQFEFRTRQCREDITKIIFYSTVPESKVVGEAEIESVIVGAPSTVWEQTKHAAGIPRSFFRQYYKGRKVAVAYKLKNVIAYDEPKSLADYGITHVPQSFIYVDENP